MFQPHRRLVLLAFVALVLTLGVSGCARTAPTWVDEGATYTTATVARLLDNADISRIAGRPTTDATKLRHEALSSLRRQGASASSVADILTSTFQPDTRGVPVYIEKASLEGTPVVIVVEATGSKTGTLKTKRLWVLGEDGSVYLARTR